jgi:hypothetical protein
VPDDLVERKDYRDHETEQLRSLVRSTVAVMTVAELRALQLPAAAVMRAQATREQ